MTGTLERGVGDSVVFKSDVVGEVTVSMDKVKELRPDVVLLDVSMPRMTGLQAVPIIRHEVPESQILIVTQHDSNELSRHATEVGAQGFVVKSDVTKYLVPAIEAAGERRRVSALVSNPTKNAAAD